MNEQQQSVNDGSILFVDDEPSILSSLRRLFRPHGWTIVTAESGAAGLAVLEQQPVDLVVSDMRMPSMDGAQFLEQVRLRWPDVERVLLTGYADIASTVAAINRGEIYRYIAKPWDDQEIVTTVREALERRQLKRENARLLALTQDQNEQLRVLNAGLEAKVAERTAELRQTLGLLEQAHEDLKRSFMDSVKSFVSLIELRGGARLRGHSRRVADTARAIARQLRLDEGEVQDVMLAGMLHDIGKMGLPDELLSRPFNTLGSEARGLSMKHPVIGQNVLLGVARLKVAAQLVRHHHECFDGSGYPDRLTGMAIPLGSRILAVANDYDALQLGTLTQRALRPDEAMAFLTENLGRRYDPEVVAAFGQWLAASGAAKVTELPLNCRRLVPGMVLSRDLAHRDGYLLLSKDQVLSEVIIKQLQRLDDQEGQPLVLYIRQENP